MDSKTTHFMWKGTYNRGGRRQSVGGGVDDGSDGLIHACVEFLAKVVVERGRDTAEEVCGPCVDARFSEEEGMGGVPLGRSYLRRL